MSTADRTFIDTARLRLRRWRDEDRAAFAAMNADAEVMRDLGGPLSTADSDAKLEHYRAAWERYDIGRWCVETLAGDFVGYTGVMAHADDHPLSAHYEIGWRLIRPAWGKGYATEASRAALADAFSRPGLHEILTYTAPDNLRSQAVMARLGLTRDASRDFTLPGPRGDWHGRVWFARR